MYSNTHTYIHRGTHDVITHTLPCSSSDIIGDELLLILARNFSVQPSVRLSVKMATKF